jgi:hypothetical protein
MRGILLAPLLLSALLGSSCWAEGEAELLGAELREVGLWKMNPGHSTFTPGSQPRSLTVRIELHANGEVFTVDKVEQHGRYVSESTLLYLDRKSRSLEDPGCSGTQSSQRLDSQTVETLHTCSSGGWTRSVWRLTGRHELVLEIIESQPDGRRSERRLVLERQVPRKQ